MINIDDFCLEQAREHQQIIIGSECTNNCSYCFLQSMPPDSQLLTIPHRSLEDISRAIDQLPEVAKEVFIGETGKWHTQRIIQGDISSRDDFLAIFEKIHARCPQAHIFIYPTNGTNLTVNILERLNAIGNIYIHLHVCSHKKDSLKKYMSAPSAALLEVLPLIKNLTGLNFSLSFTALPHLLGWEEIADALLYFQELGFSTMHINLYGYTRYSPTVMQLDPVLANRLFEEYKTFVRDLKPRLKIPMVFFPSLAEECLFVPDKGNLPFFLLESMSIGRQIAEVANRNYKIFCSQAAYAPLKRYLDKDGIGERLVAVENVSFGGNIIIAGLLTVSDFVAEINRHDCELAFIPDAPFDANGNDLMGKHYLDIQNQTGKQVLVLKTGFFNLLSKSMDALYKK